MAGLTKGERAAIRTALASWGADDHDDDAFDGFSEDDVENALGKMQEKASDPDCLHELEVLAESARPYRYECRKCGKWLKIASGVMIPTPEGAR